MTDVVATARRIPGIPVYREDGTATTAGGTSSPQLCGNTAFLQLGVGGTASPWLTRQRRKSEKPTGCTAPGSPKTAALSPGWHTASSAHGMPPPADQRRQHNGSGTTMATTPEWRDGGTAARARRGGLPPSWRRRRGGLRSPGSAEAVAAWLGGATAAAQRRQYDTDDATTAAQRRHSSARTTRWPAPVSAAARRSPFT